MEGIASRESTDPQYHLRLESTICQQSIPCILYTVSRYNMISIYRPHCFFSNEARATKAQKKGGG